MTSSLIQENDLDVKLETDYITINKKKVQRNTKVELEIVFPVYNEAECLDKSVSKLYQFLKKRISHQWQITIADNGSNDDTALIAQVLIGRWKNINYKFIKSKGRGLALHESWKNSSAKVLCYMDIDMSSDLSSFDELITPILNNSYDIVIGSRLLNTALVNRSIFREIISRCYNIILKMFFPSLKISDSQCGFKAFSNCSINKILPYVKNKNWFFDSELLILAKYNNLKIKEIPVVWVEDKNSSVKILKTIIEDLKGIIRMRFSKKKYL